MEIYQEETPLWKMSIYRFRDHVQPAYHLTLEMSRLAMEPLLVFLTNII